MDLESITWVGIEEHGLGKKSRGSERRKWVVTKKHGLDRRTWVGIEEHGLDRRT